jgi:peptide/nickel transport system permease protein
MTASIPFPAEGTALEPGAGARGRAALHRLVTNRLGLLGAVITLTFAGLGTAGAVILLVPGLRHLWDTQNLAATLLPPDSQGHLLGTDNLGRDLAWRLLASIGVSLLVGVGVTIATVTLGLLAGCAAGYFGGRRETTITGIIDLTWSFPLILVAVLAASMIGKGLTALVLGVSAVAWAGFARLVRAQVKSLREREFVEAARVLGVSNLRIILSHLLPNLAGTVIVMASYYVSITVITEAAFSFIGFGAQPPTPSLGRMIAEGRDYWSVSIWPALVPGVAIALIVLGLNSLGDALRDVFDPRQRRW